VALLVELLITKQEQKITENKAQQHSNIVNLCVCLCVWLVERTREREAAASWMYGKGHFELHFAKNI